MSNDVWGCITSCRKGHDTDLGSDVGNRSVSRPSTVHKPVGVVVGVRLLVGVRVSDRSACGHGRYRQCRSDNRRRPLALPRHLDQPASLCTLVPGCSRSFRLDDATAPSLCLSLFFPTGLSEV